MIISSHQRTLTSCAERQTHCDAPKRSDRNVPEWSAPNWDRLPSEVAGCRRETGRSIVLPTPVSWRTPRRACFGEPKIYFLLITDKIMNQDLLITWLAWLRRWSRLASCLLRRVSVFTDTLPKILMNKHQWPLKNLKNCLPFWSLSMALLERWRPVLCDLFVCFRTPARWPSFPVPMLIVEQVYC